MFLGLNIDVEDTTDSCRGSWCGVLFNLNKRRRTGVLCVEDIQKGRGREGKGKERGIQLRTLYSIFYNSITMFSLYRYLVCITTSSLFLPLWFSASFL